MGRWGEAGVEERKWEAERERGSRPGEGERINWVSVAELENFASVM